MSGYFNNRLKHAAQYVLLLMLPVCALDWPMFRGDVHRTGYLPISVKMPSTLPLWVDTIGSEIISSPSISHGTIFIGARDNTLYAINAVTGREQWKVHTGGWVDASPLIYNGRIFFGSRDGFIHCLKEDNGEVITLLKAGLQLSSPVVSGSGTIISGMGPPLTGIALYDIDMAGWTLGNAAWSFTSDVWTYSSPSISGDYVVFGNNKGKLYCIDLTARDMVWSYQTGGGIYLSTPVISDSAVYIAPGNSDHDIYAIRLNNGKLLWKTSYGNGQHLGKKRANVISVSTFVQLLRMSPEYRRLVTPEIEKAGYSVPELLLRKGLAKRSFTKDNFFSFEEAKTSSVAVDGRNVYVIQREMGYPASLFTIFALNKKTGVEQWRLSEMCEGQDIGYNSSPIVTDNAVFFGWGEGHVFALDPATGQKLWNDTLDGHIVSSPSTDSSRIYFATTNGMIYAYAFEGEMPAVDFKKNTYCYPNPVRLTDAYSNIQVYTPKSGMVTVTIYTMAERPLFFQKRRFTAGEIRDFKWDFHTAANGIYFCKIDVVYDEGKKDRKILKIAVVK